MTDEAKPVEKKLWPWEEPGELKPAQAMPVVDQVLNKASQTIDNVKAGRWPWESIKGVEKPRVEAPRALPTPSAASPIDSTVNKIIGVESGGNADAKNPNSSATGLGQFTTATWKEAVKEAGKSYTLADRKDPEKAKEILTTFTKKNADIAKQELVREPKPLDLYMYHFLGRNAAGDFLKAPLDDKATDYVSGAAARANQNIFYSKGKPVTVGDVLSKFKGKF